MISYIIEALSVLAANRVRTALTLIGLVIGVTAVIAIAVAGAGLSDAVKGTLGSISDSSFSIFPNQQQSDFTRAQIKYQDILNAVQAVPGIAAGLPLGSNERLVRVEGRHARFNVGAGPDDRFNATKLQMGRGISEIDNATSAHVCVLSDRGYRLLFPDGGDPIGESARIGDRRFEIVGVYVAPSGIAFNVNRRDVDVPTTTFSRDFARGAFLVGATFYVDDSTQLVQRESAMTSYFVKLKQGHVEYQSLDRRTASAGIDGTFAVVTAIVAMIGGISLLVAGIGILNIMLVSVTERTREIGLRKAIGATRFQVLAQFFIEALSLSVIGCGIGLVLGITIGAVVNDLFLAKISGSTPAIPWLSVTGIAVGFATLVTLAFGTYPAWRAATLDPIEALRYE